MSLNLSFAGAARPIRKTILSILVGLMGGAVTVLAQQASPDAAPPATAQTEAAPAAPAAPPTDLTPAPQAAQADATPSAPAAAPADTTPATASADAAQVAAPAAATDTKPEANSTPAPAGTPVSAAVGKDGKPLKISAKKEPKKKKEKAPKLTPVSIAQGTLTVDGWTGKARLNYDIADLKYIYMWAPEVGTVVVSNVKFPLGKEEPNAFSGNALTVDADGHTVQLSSEKKLLKDKKPASAWVYVDTTYKFSSNYPTMGYGNTIQAPYTWPGAKEVKLAKAGVAPPPPLPASMRATLAKQGCVPASSKDAGIPCAAATTASVLPADPASANATPTTPAAASAPAAPSN